MGKRFTPEEHQTINRLLDEGKTYREIGIALGRNRSTIDGYFRSLRMTEEQRQVLRLKAHQWRLEHGLAGKRANGCPSNYAVSLVRPCPVALAERDYRLSLAPRDLTAAFFGDPMPGYAALDRR